MILATLLMLAAQDYYPPHDAEGGWRTLPDAAKLREVAGVDLAKLDQCAARRQNQFGVRRQAHHIRRRDCQVIGGTQERSIHVAEQGNSRQRSGAQRTGAHGP